MIPFNCPHFTGRETRYMRRALNNRKLSGNGEFTKRCQSLFERTYGFQKCLLTTSCTDALEMAAILCDLKEGDEVIVPSYTFVSTALAFVRQGARIVFADSEEETPNLDADKLEPLITERTRVIVPVHYAGIACDMDPIMALAKKHDLLVVEDCAQAIDSFYKGRPLGTIGHLSCFSFHETKNIIAGEGGMLAINDEQFIRRSEIIWEKGTNRAEFFRGEVNKYGWVDIGSSFLPSELIACCLVAQMEKLREIQDKRLRIWNKYREGLGDLAARGSFSLPCIPGYATNNAHMFYLICPSLEERSGLISYLKARDINAVFHYQSLHRSAYYQDKHDGRQLENSDRYSDCLVRLPIFYDLRLREAACVIEAIREYCASRLDLNSEPIRPRS
jgi:dTDP-4-amino-4,6-dideoxygalactose transaminase